MSGSEQRRPTPQEDLMALLSNPDALRLLAFGARTMGKVVETGREIGKVAFSMTPGSETGAPTPQASGTEPDTPDASKAAGDARRDAPQDTAGDPAQDTAGDDALLVPVEAWNRILDQLGNLHEAGQALADARERAARAEAVAEFQAERRRLVEDELDRLKDQLAAAAAPPPPPEPSTGRAAPSTAPVDRRRIGEAIRRWWRS